MKILFTNHRLKERGSSELFTAEVTTELLHRGHEIAIFSTVGGPIAEGLRAAGLTVIEDPAACPFTPDLIHSQHHLETMAALTAWPHAPGLYFLHGYGPWEERPPLHPRLLHYAVPCPAFLKWLDKAFQIPASHTHLIRNFFDPTRFPHTRPTTRPQQRALIFHNTMDPAGATCAAITSACHSAGYTLETAGASFGKVIENPGSILPDYDLLFASGRSAMEAIACGCAVIPVTKGETGPWISPENFQENLDVNFTIPPDIPSTIADLPAILRRIRPDTLPDMAARVRQEHTLARATDQLETAYEALLALPLPQDPAAESTALAHYLTSLAAQVKQSDADRSHLMEKRDEATRRGTRWKEKADHLREQLDHLQHAMESGSWWQRRLWRQLRRSSSGNPL
jgi:hypothetical protein